MITAKLDARLVRLEMCDHVDGKLSLVYMWVKSGTISFKEFKEILHLIGVDKSR